MTGISLPKDPVPREYDRCDLSPAVSLLDSLDERTLAGQSQGVIGSEKRRSYWPRLHRHPLFQGEKECLSGVGRVDIRLDADIRRPRNSRRSTDGNSATRLAIRAGGPLFVDASEPGELVITLGSLGSLIPVSSFAAVAATTLRRCRARLRSAWANPLSPPMLAPGRLGTGGHCRGPARKWHWRREPTRPKPLIPLNLIASRDLTALPRHATMIRSGFERVRLLA